MLQQQLLGIFKSIPVHLMDSVVLSTAVDIY